MTRRSHVESAWSSVRRIRIACSAGNSRHVRPICRCGQGSWCSRVQICPDFARFNQISGVCWARLLDGSREVQGDSLVMVVSCGRRFRRLPPPIVCERACSLCSAEVGVVTTTSRRWRPLGAVASLDRFLTAVGKDDTRLLAAVDLRRDASGYRRSEGGSSVSAECRRRSAYASAATLTQPGLMTNNQTAITMVFTIEPASRAVATASGSLTRLSTQASFGENPTVVRNSAQHNATVTTESARPYGLRPHKLRRNP